MNNELYWYTGIVRNCHSDSIASISVRKLGKPDNFGIHGIRKWRFCCIKCIRQDDARQTVK